MFTLALSIILELDLGVTSSLRRSKAEHRGKCPTMQNETQQNLLQEYA